MDSERHIPGTLFRGADGNLYFIPDEALEPFRVFDSARDKVETLFDAGSQINTETLTEEEQEVVPKAQIEAIFTTLTIHVSDPSEGPVPRNLIACRYLEETGQ